MGMERLITALDFEEINILENNLEVYIIPLSSNQLKEAYRLANDLRMNGFNVDIDLMERNLKNNFKYSEKLKAKIIIIVGEEELKNHELTVKLNQSKEEFKVNQDYIISFLEEKLGELDVEV